MTTKHVFGKNSVSMEVGRYLRQRVGFPLKSKKDCAIDSGLSPKSVGYLEKHPVVRTFMQKNLIDEGVDEAALAKKLKEKLDCEHPAHEGRADNAAQLKAVDMVAKMLDAYPAQKIDIHKREESFHVSIEAKERAQDVTGEILIEPEKPKEPMVEAI